MDNTKTALLGLVGATEDETKPSPTPTGERLDNLETTTDDIILMMADLIGAPKNENVKCARSAHYGASL